MQISRKKAILILILSVIVIVSGIAGFMTSEKDQVGDKASSENSATESLVINEENISKEKLLKNKYPEVNTLVERYQEGLTSGNTSILKEVYNTSETISSNVLAQTSEIIENYSDTVCYTKPGLEDGSYVVFVYDHMKIHNINTTVPNLSLLYVKKNTEGQLFIYRGMKNSSTGTYEYDAATYQYIQLLSEDEEVKDLMATVYQEREAACSRDEQLRDFIDSLSAPLSDGVDPMNLESETESTDDTSSDKTAESDDNETSKKGE